MSLDKRFLSDEEGSISLVFTGSSLFRETYGSGVIDSKCPVCLLIRGEGLSSAAKWCSIDTEPWFVRCAGNNSAPSGCHQDLEPETDKLEILGMFPPRTEAPTADKLALCYAPHVDMTTVIEVEVCYSLQNFRRGVGNTRALLSA